MPRTATKPGKDRRPRRRLAPEARRQEIIDAARPLFCERPASEITITDIAKAAGCSRALVHSYFGDARKLFLAVVAQSGAQIAEVRTIGPDTPLPERVAANVDASLDVAAQNRESWWGVVGHRSSGDPEIDQLAEAVFEQNIQRTLDNNRGLIEDTPETRATLRALLALATEVTRLWLTDQLTREQAHALITVSTVEIIRNAIPAMERAAPRKAQAASDSS